MAKLISLLILADKQVAVGDEMVTLKAGSVHDLEPNQAKALLKEGVADDSPANIAYHLGDMERYAALMEQAKGGGKKPKKDADAEAASKAAAEAKEKAQAEADDLMAKADEEQDPDAADALRAQAQEVLKQAGIVE